MKARPQGAIDCSVGDGTGNKCSWDDMAYFDEVAIQDSVIKTKPFVDREKFIGKDRVVATSTGGTGTLRVRADPNVVSKAKLMQRASKSPSIRAGGDAVRATTHRAASHSSYPSACHALPPKPTRIPSLERSQKDANRAPIGSDPMYFTPIMPPPPPARQMRSDMPPQSRPPPKQPPTPPSPPPAPKRNLSHY